MLNFENLKSFGSRVSRSSRSVNLPKLLNDNKEIMDLLKKQVLPRLEQLPNESLEAKLQHLKDDNDFYQKRNACLMETIQKKEIMI